jgi:hypothetical protein
MLSMQNMRKPLILIIMFTNQKNVGIYYLMKNHLKNLETI